MAVNDLPLDRYLRGVVPWEAPLGWHTQTYEAQAVAARSYTLAELKAGEDFDLYPDDRSQMYGGIRAERTETNLAVGATAGQVLVWRDSDHPRLLLLELGRQDVVDPRRVADHAAGAVSRLGCRPVRLRLAASRLADDATDPGASREPCSESPVCATLRVVAQLLGPRRGRCGCLDRAGMETVLRAGRPARSSILARRISRFTR